ncbi:MAG: methyltransferase domain-containing protein, partial [Syntrophomonadaceae bacterium]|nr:methyltransferase domain-containing protein [Syntrophomonadaceae bacterium]
FNQNEELGKFDVVICSEVFEHVEDTGQLLYEITRLVREGGYLSISTPSGWMYRIPRLVNIKMFIRNPATFVKYFLFPERNWKEALQIHPAIQPIKLMNLLGKHGFRLIHRQSALWLISERGLFFRWLMAKEKKHPVKAGIQLYHHVAKLDALMNVVPFFQIFESRFVLLMEKRI